MLALATALFGEISATAATVVNPANEVDSAWRNSNNKAVSALGRGDRQSALEILLPLVRARPGYVQARENLATVYHNWALSEKEKPATMVDYLWRSLALDLFNKQFRSDLHTALGLLGKDSESFGDHLALARDCAGRGCLYGAYVEYREALWIKADQPTEAELKGLEERIKNSDISLTDNWIAAQALRADRGYEATPGSAEDDGKDGDKLDTERYANWLEALQRKIRAHWAGDKTLPVSKKIVVSFQVSRCGSLSAVQLVSSSGDAQKDQEALDAVARCGGLPLPEDGAEAVKVNFDFSLSGVDHDQARRLDLEARLAHCQSTLGENKRLSKLAGAGLLESGKLIEAGSLCKQLGNYAQAERYYNQAVAQGKAAAPLSPLLVDALVGKADCQELLGQRRSALHTLAEALDLAQRSLHLEDRQILELLELDAQLLYKDNQIEQAEMLNERLRQARRPGEKF